MRCGKEFEAEDVPTGLAWKRLYCSKCQRIVSKYVRPEG